MSEGKTKASTSSGRPKDLVKHVESMNPHILEESQKDEGFNHFTSEGTVKVEGSPMKVISILRDTGANQSLILNSVLPWTQETSTGREVSCKSAGGASSVFPYSKYG